jgi:hypothetical protein
MKHSVVPIASAFIVAVATVLTVLAQRHLVAYSVAP